MKVNYSRIETREADHTHGQIKYMRRCGCGVDAIDGEVPLCFCETCDRPIFEGDDYQADEEGVCWHTNCPEDSALPELLPCPFCGGKASIGMQTVSSDGTDETTYFANCMRCPAKTKGWEGSADEITAIEIWNRRKAD